MNRTLIATGWLLALAATNCCAEWMSAVDKKYAKNNPALYAQVAKAKALISEANGRTDMNVQAVDLLKGVLEQDPKFAPAYVQVARVSSNLGHQVNNRFEGVALQTGEDHLRAALKLEPNYDYAIALMGFTKMFQGNLVEAEKYYRQAESLGTGYPFLKSQMAQLAIKRGDYRKAIQLATQAYEDNKSEPKVAAGIIHELIYAYEQLDGDYRKELEAWQVKRRTLDPGVAWYWGDHARFRLYYVGDHEGAIKYSKKALSLMNYGVARYILAGAYYRKWAVLKDNKTRSADAAAAWAMGQELHPDPTDMIEEFKENAVLKTTSQALAARMKADFKDISRQR